MDVTARTEPEPAAAQLTANLLTYVDRWSPAPQKSVTYSGELAGKEHLETLGIPTKSLVSASLTKNELLVLGPGSEATTEARADDIAAFLEAGGRLLAIGLGGGEQPLRLLKPVEFRRGEHISSYFESQPAQSFLAGISPADVHNRDPRELALVIEGANTLGNGILAWSSSTDIVFCQLAPWHFAEPPTMNLKRTHRRIAFLVSRLLANLGATSSTPLLDRFSQPVDTDGSESRWLEGLYLDQPVEWDDPYRFFRW
jgi:hypothetical protein